MTQAGALLRNLWELWQRFWFESYQPGQLRVFRVAFGWLAFIYYLLRTPDLALFYSTRGIMPLSAIREVLPMDYRYSLLWFFPGDVAVWTFHFLFLAALLGLALGYFPRICALAAYVLHVSFMHRDMAPSYGVDLISTFFLLYLCFARYEKGVSSTASSIVYRLLQLQVCIIYAYSGLDKVRGPQWWGGEALWGVVANSQLARWDFSMFAHFPLLIVVLTYATLAWEIYFPVLVWVRPLRNLMLAFGVALHVGIGIVVNIPFFGALMIVSYTVFLNDKQVEKIEEFFSALRSRIPLIARA